MTKWFTSWAVIAGLCVIGGCGPKPAEKANSDQKDKAAATTQAKAEEEGGGHGWWCDEHGVKEAECSICQKEVFKKLKPDEICSKHPDRAKAQCFICNPDLWEKSKATYVAKYGKEPPTPEGNSAKKQ